MDPNWNQQAGEPWASQPSPAHEPGRPAEIGEVFQNAKRLLRHSLSGGLLGAYLILTAISFVATIPSWIVAFRTSADPAAVLAGVGNLFLVMGIQILVGIPVACVQIGLLRPVRTWMMHSPHAVTGTGAVLRTAVERFVPTLGILLLVGIAVALGMVLCIFPGIAAAFFLFFAPYLVTAVDTPVFEAFGRSATLAKNNAPVVLIVFVVMLFSGLAIGGIGAGAKAVLSMMVNPKIAVLVDPVMFLVQAVLGYLWLVLSAAASVTVEARAMGTAIRL